MALPEILGQGGSLCQLKEESFIVFGRNRNKMKSWQEHFQILILKGKKLELIQSIVLRSIYIGEVL